MVGWVDIQTEDVADLLDQEGIGRELETVHAMRLQGERLEHPMHRRLDRALAWAASQAVH